MASMGNTTATGALFKSSKVMHKDLPHMKIAGDLTFLSSDIESELTSLPTTESSINLR